MKCPNINSPEFKALTQIFGENKAYYLWNENNGNPLHLAPNGKESNLFKDILQMTNNPEQSLQIKSKIYSKNFKDWFGISKEILDKNGEPILKGNSIINKNGESINLIGNSINNSNRIQYQNNTKQTIEEFVASEKTIKDLSERLSDRIGIPIRFINNKDLDYKGKFDGEKATINLANATLDTPIHEILGHPIIAEIKKNNKTLYNNLLKELNTERGKEILSNIKDVYTTKYTSRIEYLSDEEVDELEKKGYIVEKIKQLRSNKIEGKKRYRVKKLEKYTLKEHERKEEAIVQLLSEYVAGRLNETKDKNLISLLKELLKKINDFVKSLLTKKELEIAKLPDILTLSDLADILAYSNSKIILQGYEVTYTTPDNKTFKTYAEANKYISNLKKLTTISLADKPIIFIVNNDTNDFIYYTLNKDSDIKNITNDIENLLKYNYDSYFNFRFETDEYGREILVYDYKLEEEDYEEIKNNKLRQQHNPDWKNGRGKIFSFAISTPESKEILLDILNKKIDTDNYRISDIDSFIDYNYEFEQSNQIIEEWKKLNNIVYNPEEVYSRNQGFYSAIGAYSSLDLELLLQNLITHIEDNKKTNGSFIISAFTKPVDKTITHLESGSKIKFIIYPNPENIKWATNKDAYSGSVWDAPVLMNLNLADEQIGISYTKAPKLRNLDVVVSSLGDIIDNLEDGHNELGIELTTTNFRLVYDENIPYKYKKIVDSINSILDEKYGKINKPDYYYNPIKNNPEIEVDINEVKDKIINGKYNEVKITPISLKNKVLLKIKDKLKNNDNLSIREKSFLYNVGIEEIYIMSNNQILEEFNSIFPKIDKEKKTLILGHDYNIDDINKLKKEYDNFVEEFRKTLIASKNLINKELEKAKEYAKAERDFLNLNKNKNATKVELELLSKKYDNFYKDSELSYHTIALFNAQGTLSGYWENLDDLYVKMVQDFYNFSPILSHNHFSETLEEIGKDYFNDIYYRSDVKYSAKIPYNELLIREDIIKENLKIATELLNKFEEKDNIIDPNEYDEVIILKKPKYDSQAKLNLKLALLKLESRKFPRSLIRHEVKRIKEVDIKTKYSKDIKANLTDEVTPVKGLEGNDLNSKEFVEANNFHKTEVEFNKRGDKTYSILFDLADKYDIQVKGELQDLNGTQSLEDTVNIASYDPVTNTINLDKKFTNLNKLSQVRVYSHEVIHGIINKELQNKSPEEYNRIKQEFTNYINSLREFQNDPEIKRVLDIIDNSSWEEIITYGLTDKNFAMALNAIVVKQDVVQVKKKTLWDKLMELISSIISDDYTKLNELIRILNFNFDIQTSKELDIKLNNPNSITEQQKKYAKNKEIIESTPQSKLSREEKAANIIKTTTNKVEDAMLNFLDKIGVSFERVDEIVDRNGNPIDALGKADLINQVVQVVKYGAGYDVLIEEAAHMFVKLLDPNSKLYKQMMNNIDKFDIYEKVKLEYGDIYYHNEAKLREEAVGQLIRDLIIRQYADTNKPEIKEVEKSVQKRNFFQKWFDKVIDYLRKLFGTANTSPLEKYTRVANMLMKGDISQLRSIDQLQELEYELVYYNLTDAEKKSRDKILEKFKNPEVRLDDKTHIYYKQDGTRITNVVSDSVTEYYYKLFKNIGNTDEKAMLAAHKGTFGHAILQRAVEEMKNIQDLDILSEKVIDLIDRRAEILNEVKYDLRNKLPDFNTFDDSFFHVTPKQFGELVRGVAALLTNIKVNNDKINASTGVKTSAEIFTELPIYDESTDTAGTIDMAVVYSNGVVGIYDFKFMQFKGFESTVYETPQYKREAFDIQLNKYKQILKLGVGVNNFGESRIIPINMQLNTDKSGEIIKNGFSKIEMWNYSGTRDYLDAIPVAGERTNYTKLNKALDTMEKYRTTLNAKINKDPNNIRLRERLSNLNKSIDKLILYRDVNYVLDELRDIWREFDIRKRATFQSPDKMTPEDLGDLLQFLDYYQIYYDFSIAAKEIWNPVDPNNPTKQEKEILEKSKKIPDFLLTMRNEIHDAIYEYFLHHYKIDLTEDIKDVQMLGRVFRQLSEFDHPAFRVLSDTIKENTDNTRKNVNKLIDTIKEKRDNLKKWANENNLSLYEAYEILINEKSGNLIGRYREDYFERYTKAAKEKDVKWIKENTEYLPATKPGYKSKMEQDRAAYYNSLKKEIFGKDQEEKEIRIKIKMDAWDKRYNYLKYDTALYNTYNYYIRLKDNSSWYNDKFKYISQNKPLLDYWQMYMDFNEEFMDITGRKIKRNFIAEIKHDIVSSAAQTGLINSMKNFSEIALNAFVMEEFDPASIETDVHGNPIPAIPLRHRKLITKAATKEEINQIKEDLKKEGYKEDTGTFRVLLRAKINALEIEKGRELKSSDLTENMILFAKTAYAHKYYTDTENIARSLQEFLKSGRTNTVRLDATGNVLVNKLKGTVMKKLGMSSELIQTFDNFVNLYWYGGVSKNELRSFRVGNKYDENGQLIKEGRIISATKVVEGVMAYTSIFRLALKPVLSAGNAFGIFSNAYMLGSEGIYYDKQQLGKAFTNLTTRDKTTYAAYKFFEATAKDLTYEKGRKLSGSFWTKYISMDTAFFMFKHPDEWIEKMVLDAMMMNYTIIKNDDGIYDLVRISKVKNKTVKSLKEMAKYDEKSGKFSFDGLDMNDKNVQKALTKFRSAAQKRGTQIKGAIPEEDKFLANQYILGKLLLQFRTWIPGLFKTRFKSFEYDNDVNEADVGRFNVFYQELVNSGSFLNTAKTLLKTSLEMLVQIPGIRKLTNYSVFDNNMNEIPARRLYAKLVKQGKINPQEYSFKDFLELRAAKMKGMASEIGAYVSMMLLVMFAKAMVPDECRGSKGRKNPKCTTWDKWSANLAANGYKALYRGLLESSFWFDPNSPTSWLDKPMVILGTIADLRNLLGNTFDVAGDLLKDEDDPYRAILKKSYRDKTPMFYYTSKFVPGINTVTDWINYWDKPLVTTKH